MRAERPPARDPAVLARSSGDPPPRASAAPGASGVPNGRMGERARAPAPNVAPRVSSTSWYSTCAANATCDTPPPPAPPGLPGTSLRAPAHQRAGRAQGGRAGARATAGAGAEGRGGTTTDRDKGEWSAGERAAGEAARGGEWEVPGRDPARVPGRESRARKSVWVAPAPGPLSPDAARPKSSQWRSPPALAPREAVVGGRVAGASCSSAIQLCRAQSASPLSAPPVTGRPSPGAGGARATERVTGRPFQ